MSQPLRGSRVLYEIEVEEAKSANKSGELQWGDKYNPIVYWKKGIGDYFGKDACKPVDILEAKVYKSSDIYVAVKKDNANTETPKKDTKDNAPGDDLGENKEIEEKDYEIVQRGVRISRPRGSFRQQAIKVLFKEDIEFNEYDRQGKDIGKRNIALVSLAYDRKYKITILSWLKWLSENQKKDGDIIKVITPAGISYPVPSKK